MNNLDHDFEKEHPREAEYVRILDRLYSHEPFGFSRFNDGERLCMEGAVGGNCDGHQYFPSLGRALRETLSKPQSYDLALGDLEFDSKCGYPDIPWVNACALMWGLEQEKLERFFHGVSSHKHDAVLVGPSRLASAAPVDWSHVVIPQTNCWKAIEYMSDKTLKHPKVYVIAAGMPACVLVHRIRNGHPESTAIDVGSVLDPIAGFVTRSYQLELPWANGEKKTNPD